MQSRPKKLKLTPPGIPQPQLVERSDRRRAMLERLSDLGRKAKANPKALTLSEIDELCRLVEALKPPNSEEPLTPESRF